MSSSSDCDDFDNFLASLRPKKKEKYRYSSGSFDSFIVEDEHVSFVEDAGSMQDKDCNYSTNADVLSDLKNGISRLNLLQGSEENQDDSLDGFCEPGRNGERCHEGQRDGYTSARPSNDNDGKGFVEKNSTATSEREQSSSFSLHANLEERNNKHRNHLKVSSLTPKYSTASSRVKSVFETPKIFFSSDSEDSSNEDTVANNISGFATDDFVMHSGTKRKTYKNCSGKLLSVDDSLVSSLDDSMTFSNRLPKVGFINGESDVARSAENLDGLVGFQYSPKKLSGILDFGDSEDSSPTAPQKTLKEDSKSCTDPTSPVLIKNFPVTTADYNPLTLTPERHEPIIMPRAKSAAKKASLCLVSSDDSSGAESDLDKDVIFINDENEDKENLEKNVFESPESSPSESISASDDTFKVSKISTKKKVTTFLDNDVYIPLASRVFGRATADSTENVLRRTSEPEPHKKLATPARKPPKNCQTERVKSGKLRSDGLPLFLPLNCEKGIGFKRNRELLAKNLYNNFNKTVFSNSLPEDMAIEWSKRLAKTAAVTKCSARTVMKVENGMSRAVNTHHATISLSMKVLDTLDRLRDTLCHEMCHAAVWLIDLRNDGHGSYWKTWARKAMAAHPEMPMVKRCHSYDITYKFQYQCMGCRKIYGRHSKSIKVDKQTCGLCCGKLILLPQKNNDGTPAKSRTPNKFAMFVKENYTAVQRANSIGLTTPKHSDVMKALSKQFGSLSVQK